MSPTEAVAGVTTHAFRDDLLRNGLLIPTGVPGIYGRSHEFEDTLVRVDRLIGAIGEDDRAEVIRFPPVLNRTDFERSGYLASFPHLAGTIHSFAGNDRAHSDVLRAVEQGGEWSAAFPAAGVVLTPAACYPVYPMLSGTLPVPGRLVDVMSYCFRHEPSEDAGRMQMFRMHEHVRAAAPETVVEWREMWLGRVEWFVDALGLDTRAVVASDPFFGRGGTLLAESQRDQRLKLEFAAPIDSDESPTALISLNYHQEHFGALFDILTVDGTVAHTACVGFGLERITLALYRRHGFKRSQWTSPVREALNL